MLLRSSSAPIPSSCLPHYHSSHDSSELSILHYFPRTSSSFSLITTSTRSPIQAVFSITQLSNDDDDDDECQRIRRPIHHHHHHEKLSSETGMGMGSNNGSDGGHGSPWNHSSSGGDSTDAYYQKMIEANPNNSLLLANYAKFLKEVIGDYGKAEEYLERAILANPRDGIVLSQYADLIWHTQENADRAESYYNQAVQSSPHDCYVHASYAKFLWETDGGEGKEEKEEVKLKEWQHKSDHKHTYPPHDLLQNYPTTTLL